jgi:hypothetical protein
MSEHLVPNQSKKTQSKVLPKDGNIVFQKNTQIRSQKMDILDPKSLLKLISELIRSGYTYSDLETLGSPISNQ